MKKLLLLIAFIIVVVGAYAVGTKYGAFGDAYNAQKTDPRITAAHDMLIGTWSNVDDRNFNRKYKEDGTFADSYSYETGSGALVSSALWSLFTADSNEDVPFQMNNTDVYLKQTEADGMNMYFRIVSVTPTELELMNMDRGNALRFGKLTTSHELQDGQEDPMYFGD